MTRRICSFNRARSSFKLLSRSSVNNRSSSSARSLLTSFWLLERDGEAILSEYFDELVELQADQLVLAFRHGFAQ